MQYQYLQVAELASLAQLLSPRSPTVHNPAPDSSLCRAAPRLRQLQLLLPACVASAAAPGLPPLPAAASGPDCGIRFNCCSPFASASSCCSPIAPASAAARRLRPLQLLLPIASASASTPQLRPLQLLLPDCACWIPAHAMPGPNVLEHSSGVRGSVNKLKYSYEGRASL